MVSSIIMAERGGNHDQAVQRVRTYDGRLVISKARSQRLEHVLGAVGLLLLLLLLALGAIATLAGGKAQQVTISFGLAELADGDDCPRLTARADEVLYRAKKGGRNQVQLAA